MSPQCGRLGPMGSLTGLWAPAGAIPCSSRSTRSGTSRRDFPRGAGPLPLRPSRQGRARCRLAPRAVLSLPQPASVRTHPGPTGLGLRVARGPAFHLRPRAAKQNGASPEITHHEASRLFSGPQVCAPAQGQWPPHPGVHGQVGTCDRRSGHPVPRWAGGGTTHGVRARMDGSTAVPSRVRWGRGCARC